MNSPRKASSNDSGGVLGGISSGQDIVANLALKPTSSLRIPGQSIDKFGKSAEVITTGRHDPCGPVLVQCQLLRQCWP